MKLPFHGLRVCPHCPITKYYFSHKRDRSYIMDNLAFLYIFFSLIFFFQVRSLVCVKESQDYGSVLPTKTYVPSPGAEAAAACAGSGGVLSLLHMVLGHSMSHYQLLVGPSFRKGYPVLFRSRCRVDPPCPSHTPVRPLLFFRGRRPGRQVAGGVQVAVARRGRPLIQRGRILLRLPRCRRCRRRPRLRRRLRLCRPGGVQVAMARRGRPLL